MKSRTAILVALVLSFPGWSQGTAAFSDAFEGATLNPFWQTFTNSGSITFPSTLHVHGGTQALQLNTVPPFSSTGGKTAGVRHLFSPPTFGQVDAWLYDNGASAVSSNYQTLHTNAFDLGTWDYNLGSANGGQYIFQALGASGNTGVSRTVGWHHFVIRTSLTASSLLIDGITVHAGVGGTPLTEVQLEIHAPTSRPAFTTYWDDFAFDPCGGVPCGQSNSTCAALTVNGIGVSGPGPFAVAAPPGSQVALVWGGPANQPYALFITPQFITGQQLGGALIVDIDLSSFVPVFNGANLPAGFPYYTDFSGQAMQVFAVPPALAGTLIRVQGLVFDTANTCSGGIGFMTTASFAIQF